MSPQRWAVPTLDGQSHSPFFLPLAPECSEEWMEGLRFSQSEGNFSVLEREVPRTTGHLLSKGWLKLTGEPTRVVMETRKLR